MNQSVFCSQAKSAQRATGPGAGLRSCRSGVALPVALAAVNGAAWLSLAALAPAGGSALLGAGALAYFLGLRHGFDADHIAAIDNVSRKLRQDGKRTASAGFFFALGHSTVVALLSLIAVVASRWGIGGGLWLRFGLHSAAGALCSAAFLTLIGVINVAIFRSLWRALRAHGEASPAHMSWEAIDDLLAQRGALACALRFLYRRIDAAWKMYPIGALFGLSFDTASEVAILGLSTTAALRGGLPFWGVMVFPLLFAAGMSLVDTLDGILVTSIYDWTSTDPLRKLRFNLLLTGLSAGLALVVAGGEWFKLFVVGLRLEGPLYQALDDVSSARAGVLATAVIVAAWLFSRQRYVRLLRQGRALTRRVIVGASSALVALLARHPALADGERRAVFTVHGHAADALKRSLPGVQIELRSADHKLAARTESDARGEFTFERVAPGVFAVVGRKAGFKPGIVIVNVGALAPPKPIILTLESEQALTAAPLTAAVRRAQNGVTGTGVNRYTMTSRDIQNLPEGEYTPLNEVLLQMPGVALDQNQEIHIRGEHMGIQYQMNGILLPLDLNSDPTFVQLLNSFFLKRVSLVDGVLPARYGFRTAGIIDLETKTGCEEQGGNFTVYGGQRETAEPSFELAGCHDGLSYFFTGLYQHNNLGFSSATPAPDPIHDLMNQGQGFGYVTYDLNPLTRLSLITGFTVNQMQFPNQMNEPPLYQYDDVNPLDYPSAAINSSLAQQDYFAVLALNGTLAPDLTYQLAYTAHYNREQFTADPVGDLIYEGVASNVANSDFSNTLQGDVTYHLSSKHTLAAGFYFGDYDVTISDYSLAFPANADGEQTSTTPVSVANRFRQLNLLVGVYLQDTWRLTEKLSVNYGARFDYVTGFSEGHQVSPTINFLYAATADTALHAGFARYFQVPNFQGISPATPSLFAGTTGAVGVPGPLFPEPEHDYYWDVGATHRLAPHLMLTQDNYFRLDRHYLDEGNFGFVPIDAPFNYKRGYGWGVENALTYNLRDLSLRGNVYIAREEDIGVATGQYNFTAAELAYMNSRYFILDHTPLVGASGGVAYRWGAYQFTADGLYSSGLRGGFANTIGLPDVWQINLSAAREFSVPELGKVTNRIVLINIFDRTNLIRPPIGIGVFQAAYGPRIAVYDALTIPLPLL